MIDPMLFALLACAKPPAPAAELPVSAAMIEHAGARYGVVSLDLRRVDLQLLGQRAGEPRSLPELRAWLGDEELLLATNAGIFHDPNTPVGLFVAESEVVSPLNLSEGQGNFFMKPNGVFAVLEDGRPVVVQSSEWRDQPARLATQSGPMLLTHGQIHPAFDPASTSLRTRSGVGVSGGTTVHFVISYDRVRFHDLATLFRDELGCADALYLDGEISALEAPGLRPERHRGPYAGLLVATPRD